MSGGNFYQSGLNVTQKHKAFPKTLIIMFPDTYQ